MILVDFQQIALATLLVSLDTHTNTRLNEDMLRHMILNSIRANRKKFLFEYGELIICCDHHSKSWRKLRFPYYKAHRREEREKIDLDWGLVFASLDKIKRELKDHFPYRTIEVENAEADDVIAILLKDILSPRELHLILSKDKDFIQLHNDNVRQYDPIKKRFIRHANPAQYLKEHVLHGDRGDGIPNVLSADDCLVMKHRQKKMTHKIKNELLAGKIKDINISKNYERNLKLISLDHIPEDIKDNIVIEYEKQKGKNRNNLFNYFVHNKLKNLMGEITDF